MSNINCDSCADLREYAPEFVQNGVTSRVSTSLKNNTGFNPSLSVLHENCEDLNDANDCLIGRLPQELAGYDVCEWKEFMSKLLPNQYEMLKALIASDCGQWDKLDPLCESIDNILGLIQGDAAKSHPGTWLESFYNKLEIKFGSASGDVVQDPHVQKPSIDADIHNGAGCDATKRLGRWQPSTYYTVSPYPYTITSIRITSDLSVGEVIGYVRRADVPTSDVGAGRWKQICRSGGVWPWYIINRDTIWYIQLRGYTIIDGVALNTDLQEYGEDTLVFLVHSFIGPSRSGGCVPPTSGNIKSYIA